MPKNDEKNKANVKEQEKTKDDSLKEALEVLNKKYGDECTSYLSSQKKIDVVRFSSGSLALDEILGGGFPKGRIVEIFGPEGGGKTTLALQVIAEVQKNGGTAVFVDTEHALNPEYVENIGVNKEKLIFSQPNSGEEALDIVYNLCKFSDVIVVDSVASIVPKSEKEGNDIFETKIAPQARLMSTGLRNIVAQSSPTSALIIFINQIRQNLSLGGFSFGSPETTPGGKSLKFFTSIRLEIRKSEIIKKGDEIIGAKAKIKTIKNKIASPYQTCNVDIIYGKGFDRNGDILDMGVKYDFIKKTGSWYEFNGKKIAQGRENMIDFLRKNKEIANDLYNKISSIIKEGKDAISKN